MAKRDKTPGLFEPEAPPAPSCEHAIRVALGSAADTEFDYLVPDALWPVPVGQRVEVPFGRGNKPETGFCVASDVAHDRPLARDGRRIRLKCVSKVVDEPPLLGPELARKSSHNHDGDGQNVLYLQGNVAWRPTPAAGVSGDNIFLAEGIEEYVGTEEPTKTTDSFLLPTYSNSGK